MLSTPLHQLCGLLEAPVRSVGRYIVAQQARLANIQIDHKSLNSLVSEVDIEAEKRLVGLLADLLPEAGFLTEEQTISQAVKPLRWVIDPLDGTTNFLHGLPHFSISIALEQNGKIILGIVLDCAREEYFYGWEGGGAWLNGQAIHVTKTTALAQSLLATGFPYYDFEKMEAYLEVLRYMMKNTRGLRRFGSAALDLAWVACGRYDGFFEYGLNPWDVGAGILLIEEAGGRITDFSNGPTVINGKEILGSNGALHQLLINEIGNKLG